MRMHPCQNCGVEFALPRLRAGESVACPGCGHLAGGATKSSPKVRPVPPPDSPSPTREPEISLSPMDPPPKIRVKPPAPNPKPKSAPPIVVAGPPPVAEMPPMPFPPAPKAAANKRRKLHPALVAAACLAIVAAGAYFGLRKKADPAPVPAEVVEKSGFKDRGTRRPGSAPPRPTDLKPADIDQILIPSTVLITTPKSRGSGVLIYKEPNLILTNAHVIDGQKEVTVYFPDVQKGQVIRELSHYESRKDQLGLKGKVIERDVNRDLALVEIKSCPASAESVPLASESAGTSETVHGVGQSRLWKTNKGAVSSHEPQKFVGGSYRSLITSQNLNPGDSGGPVVNTRLELVGIAEAKDVQSVVEVKRDGKSVGNQVVGNDNVNYVIDVAEVRDLVEAALPRHYKQPFRSTGTVALRGNPASPAEQDEQWTAAELVGKLETCPEAEIEGVCRELIPKGGDAVELLMATLTNTKFGQRWPKAFHCLQMIGSPSAPAIDLAISALNGQSDGKVRQAAAKFLGAVIPLSADKRRAAEDALWRQVASSDAELRGAAQRALERYGPYDGDQKTITALKRRTGWRPEESKPDKNEKVSDAQREAQTVAFVIHLLCGITTLKAEELTGHLEDLRVFNHSDSRLRRFCASVVARDFEKFKRVDAFRILVPLLGDSETAVAAEAREILDDLTWDRTQDRYITVDQVPAKTDEKTKDRVTFNKLFTGYRLPLRSDRKLFTITHRSEDNKDLGPYTLNGETMYFCRVSNLRTEDVSELLNNIVSPKAPAPCLEYVFTLIATLGDKAQLDLDALQNYLKSKPDGDDTIPVQDTRAIVAALKLALVQGRPLDTLFNPICALAEHVNEDMRSLALACLSWMEQDHHAPPKSNSLAPSKPPVLATRRMLEIFFKALDDTNADIRRAAAEALKTTLTRRSQRYKTVEEVSLCQAALKRDRQLDSRVLASLVLFHARDKAAPAIRELLDALDDESYTVRHNAIDALRGLTGLTPAQAARLGKFLAEEIDEDRLTRATRDGRLAGVETDSNWFNRMNAADRKEPWQNDLRILEKRLSSAYSKGISRLADDERVLIENENLRRAALTTLLSLGKSAVGAVPDILTLLRKSPDPRYRVMALRVLGEIGPDLGPSMPAAVEACLRQCKNEFDLVNPRLAKPDNSSVSTKPIGDGWVNLTPVDYASAADAILETESNKRSSVTNAALEALIKMGPAAARPIHDVIEPLTRRRRLGSDICIAFAGVEVLYAVSREGGPKLEASFKNDQTLKEDLRQVLMKYELRLKATLDTVVKSHPGVVHEALDRGWRKFIETRKFVEKVPDPVSGTLKTEPPKR